MTRSFLLVLGTLVLAALPARSGAQEGPSGTWVITNARLADGTGSPLRAASVRVRGDRITDVGSVTPAAGERVVDAGGLVLAPGFIDTHSHHDRRLLDLPDALAVVSQGITTIVAGQDGGSRYPLRDFFHQLESAPVAVNVASYVGHGTIRRRVLGDDFRRAATAAEVDQMRRLLETELAAGALDCPPDWSTIPASTRRPRKSSRSPGSPPGSGAGTSATCAAKTGSFGRRSRRPSALAGKRVSRSRSPT